MTRRYTTARIDTRKDFKSNITLDTNVYTDRAHAEDMARLLRASEPFGGPITYAVVQLIAPEEGEDHDLCY